MSTATLTRYLVYSILALALPTAAAYAQPNAGQVAAGGEIGVFIPADEQLSPGFTGGGLFEFYATRRVGVRGTIMTIRNGYDRRDDDDERQIRFGADVIYNWEFGRIHPFAGGGLAMHLLRFYRDGDNQGANDTEFGVQGLGGVEFFLNRAWTVKTEGRYQWVGDRPHLDPDGLSLTVGLKRYF